tara:strand:+ start:637 stop:870 length:234 start_codon:yes stop_codon:yes gene_type:complete
MSHLSDVSDRFFWSGEIFSFMYAEDELNNNPVAHTVTVTSKSRHDQPTRVFVQYAIFSTISVFFIVRIRVIFEYRAN